MVRSFDFVFGRAKWLGGEFCNGRTALAGVSTQQTTARTTTLRTIPQLMWLLTTALMGWTKRVGAIDRIASVK